MLFPLLNDIGYVLNTSIPSQTPAVEYIYIFNAFMYAATVN